MQLANGLIKNMKSCQNPPLNTPYILIPKITMKILYRIMFLLIGGCFQSSLAADTPITNGPVVVMETSFKLGMEEKEIHLGFDKGDEVVFDFEVIKGKPVKEVDFAEYLGNLLYSDFKSKKITKKRFKINRKGIYFFRFKGGGLGGKVCKVHIERIPGPDSSPDFNTNIVWETRNDTTIKYQTKRIIVGYDTTYTTKYRAKLIKVDTTFVNLTDRTERVHSQTNLENDNISKFSVNLPRNEKTELYSKKVISWAYWIGVGNEGHAAFEAEKKKFIQNNIASTISAVNPLAGLAIGAYSIAAKPPAGDNIHYWFTTYYDDGTSRNLANGNSVSSFGRETKILQGGFKVTLQNDNLMNGINVNVKVMVAQEVRQYEREAYQDPKIKAIREDKVFETPTVKVVEFPVMDH